MVVRRPIFPLPLLDFRLPGPDSRIRRIRTVLLLQLDRQAEAVTTTCPATGLIRCDPTSPFREFFFCGELFHFSFFFEFGRCGMTGGDAFCSGILWK